MLIAHKVYGTWGAGGIAGELDEHIPGDLLRAGGGATDDLQGDLVGAGPGQLHTAHL